MVNETEKVGKRNIVKTISTPHDIEELKSQLNSLTEINNRLIVQNTLAEQKKKSWFSNITIALKGNKK